MPDPVHDAIVGALCAVFALAFGARLIRLRSIPSARRWLAGFASAWVGTLAAMALPAASQDGVNGALSRLEALAGRQPSRAQAELDSLLKGRPTLDRNEQIRIQFIRLLIADAQARPEDALAQAEALDAQAEVRDDAGKRWLLEHVRFDAYYQQDRSDMAELAIRQELDQARRSKLDDALAQALLDQARLLMKRGDYEQACASIADAQRHAQGLQIGAEVRFSNAILARTIGDWPLALQSYRDAYDRFHAVEDRTGEADSQAGAGSALNELSRASEAVGPLDEAIATYRQVGDKEGEAIALGELALSQAALGRPEQALATNAEGIEQLARVHSLLRMAQLQIDRARLLLGLKRPGEALALVERARGQVLGSDDLKLRVQFHEAAAGAQAALGFPAVAYQESQRGLDAQRHRTEQLVARQLAAQRGRLGSELLTRENALLRSEADASQGALVAARRAARLQGITIGLAVLIIFGSAAALWRQSVLMRRIARMAETDPLTGISNRRHVIELGMRLMARCSQGGRPYALMLLDLDRFKQINDGHGHSAGDAALCAISQCLRTHLRPDDQLGRYGGEEFAVILPGADRAEASAVAERLRAAVAALAPDWAPEAGPMTLSGGIAIARDDRSDFSQLLMRADQALYRAKNAGRNRIEIDSD